MIKVHIIFGTIVTVGLAPVFWFIFGFPGVISMAVGALSASAAGPLVLSVWATRASRKLVATLPDARPVPYRWDYVLDVRTVDDNPVDLSEAKGKILVLVFWATGCYPCFSAMPSIERLQEKLEDLDVQFACLSHESPQVVREFLRKKMWSLPTFLFKGPRPLALSGPLYSVIVVGKDGAILQKQFAPVRWDSELMVRFLRECALG